MNRILLTVNQKIYIAAAIFAVVLIVLIALIFYIKTFYEKKHFKEATYARLSLLARNNDYLLLNNYKLDFDDSHIGVIDHLLITKKYIYAINDFPLSGVIKGELKGRTLNVIDFKQKVTQMNNPLNYNINLIKRFNIYNNLDQSFVKGIVVVNDDAYVNIENLSDQFMMIPRNKLAKTILDFDKCNEKNFKEETIVKFINKLSKESK